MKSNTLVVWCLFVLLFFFSKLDIAHAEMRTFTDTLGRVVTISYPPKRILSLTPDITETLFALGLSDEIVGVTRFSNFPSAAKEKPRVGPYTNINVEAVINLEPDLILATRDGNPRRPIEKLERMGFPVYVVYPRDFDGIMTTIQQIGRIVGRENEGKTIAQQMEQRVKEVSQRVTGRKKPKVFLQIGRSPIYTVAKGSFAHHLISLAGGDNIARDAKIPYPSYSREEILLKAPEVIIISSMYVVSDHAQWLDEWKKWKILPAVKNHRLYTIDSDLIDRPSPRIVEGLERMARMIHPEVFTEVSPEL
jgi:iron complex transport system substrate-binding protein